MNFTLFLNLFLQVSALRHISHQKNHNTNSEEPNITLFSKNDVPGPIQLDFDYDSHYQIQQLNLHGMILHLQHYFEATSKENEPESQESSVAVCIAGLMRSFEFPKVRDGYVKFLQNFLGERAFQTFLMLGIKDSSRGPNPAKGNQVIPEFNTSIDDNLIQNLRQMHLASAAFDDGEKIVRQWGLGADEVEFGKTSCPPQQIYKITGRPTGLGGTGCRDIGHDVYVGRLFAMRGRIENGYQSVEAWEHKHSKKFKHILFVRPDLIFFDG